jgi:hypothetical protein
LVVANAPAELLLATGVGMVVGLLPDLLEPALHPNHRQFFHSYAVTALLAHADNTKKGNLLELRECRWQ